MAVTRSFLRGLGLDEEKVSAIIEAHTETVDGLKAQITEANNNVSEAVDALKAYKESGWEQKYNDLNAQFENYKSEQTAKDARAKKEKAYIDILKKVGVGDKFINTILKVTDIGKFELDDNGNAKDEKALIKSIKDDYSAFITTQSVKGADVQKPPVGGTGGTMTRDQIMSIKDREARLAAIRENPNAFRTHLGKE